MMIAIHCIGGASDSDDCDIGGASDSDGNDTLIQM